MSPLAQIVNRLRCSFISTAGLQLVMQGGRIELGAPTGRWQMIVVYRGKHCPVSKNYLASLQQIYYELDELGVEVIAVSGDGRERAEAFVSSPQLMLHSCQFAIHTGSVMVGYQWRARTCMSLPHWLAHLSKQYHTQLCRHMAPENWVDGVRALAMLIARCGMLFPSDSMRGVLRMQLEALKATTDTKEVSFKIAYGLPISEMLRWGLYISGAISTHIYMRECGPHADSFCAARGRLCACSAEGLTQKVELHATDTRAGILKHIPRWCRPGASLSATLQKCEVCAVMNRVFSWHHGMFAQSPAISARRTSPSPSRRCSC